jgi:hypothetical protein
MNVLTKLGATAVLTAAFAAGASAGETIEEIVVIGQRPSWSLPIVLDKPAESAIRTEVELNLDPAMPLITEPAVEIASAERNLG